MITEQEINEMDYTEMLRLRRHAPIGHPCFRLDNPLHEVFMRRWKELDEATSYADKAKANEEVGW